MRYFNPRAYVRHDPIIAFPPFFDRRFQSTCLREARQRSSIVRNQSIGFQSTCLREARRGCGRKQTAQADFNPRAYVRHDRANRSDLKPKNKHFNPRAYVRHDVTSGKPPLGERISIHVPT